MPGGEHGYDGYDRSREPAGACQLFSRPGDRTERLGSGIIAIARRHVEGSAADRSATLVHAGLLRDGGADARAGHWCQQRGVQRRERRAHAAVARRRSRPSRRRLADGQRDRAGGHRADGAASQGVDRKSIRVHTRGDHGLAQLGRGARGRARRADAGRVQRRLVRVLRDARRGAASRTDLPAGGRYAHVGTRPGSQSLQLGLALRV